MQTTKLHIHSGLGIAFLTALFSTTAVPRVQAQTAPDLAWVVQAGGTDGDVYPADITVDSSGNTYVTGDFGGHFTFGKGQPNETTLFNHTTSDGSFLAKYDRAGALVWAKRVGAYAESAGIAVDSAGNSYVTGTFRGSATFGAGEATETALTSAAQVEMFLARYDSTGALVWAKQASGTSFDFSKSIDVDASGNSYITGYFDGSATFGAGGATATTLTSHGRDDIYLARYDSTGALVWAKQAGDADAGGTDSDRAAGIRVDASGNSYITGYFGGAATFGAGGATATTLTSDGDSDIFLARYDSTGTLVWAKQAGGTSSDDGYAVDVDASGNSYITGYFGGAATFGAGGATATTLTSDGDSDIFLARYDSTGTLVWAKQAGGTSRDIGNRIYADASGNRYISGTFEGTAIFGPGEAGQTMLTGAFNGNGTFVAKYDSAGMLVWAKQPAGYASATVVDAVGNIWVTGGFDGTLTFGADGSNPTTLTSTGLSDLFLLQYAAGPEISFDSLAGLVRQFVTRPLIRTALLAEVAYAQRLSEHGNTALMNYVLRLFVQSVSQFSGTVLTGDQAAILIQVANGLMQ